MHRLWVLGLMSADLLTMCSLAKIYHVEGRFRARPAVVGRVGAFHAIFTLGLGLHVHIRDIATVTVVDSSGQTTRVREKHRRYNKVLEDYQHR